jgi:ppGpp synthetase/RelA/SpoT-type nucleotidyltranferase
VRTVLVCRYIDGPATVCAAIKEVAGNLGLECNFEPRATDQGYYAYHLYLSIPMSLFVDGNPHTVNVSVEIQVTTQLQEILRGLTHPYYRVRRISEQVDRNAANWDYASNNFRASYLGHTLHLIEGMIVSLRDEAKRIDDESEPQKG